MNNQHLKEAVRIRLVLQQTLIAYHLIVLRLVSIVLIFFHRELVLIDLHCDTLSIKGTDLAQFEVIVRETLLLCFILILILARVFVI